MTTRIRIPTIEMLMKSETNWPKVFDSRVGEVKISPLQKLSPFAVQKGFSGSCRNPGEHLKTEMAPSWWSAAKGPRPKTCSEQTDLLTDQSRSQFTRPPNSSRGVIGCRDLADMSEVESNNNNNVHLSCAHQRPERSHDTY